MDYFDRTLIPFVDRLIKNYATYDEDSVLYIDFEELPDFEKLQLSKHFFIYDGADMSFMSEVDYKITNKLINLLDDEDSDTKKDFSESVIEGMINFYSKKSTKIIEERLSLYESESLNYYGYRKERSRDTGEIMEVRL